MTLRERFPRTHEWFRTLPDGEAALLHLTELERDFSSRVARMAELLSSSSSLDAPDEGATLDYDVVVAGGGLSLFYAAYFASKGLKVAIFDRRRIGHGHREWNISRQELAPLIESGLFTQPEVDALIELEYDHGIVRWHGGGTYPVRHVLDCVVDASALLTQLRARAEQNGATLLDGHSLSRYAIGRGGVAVEVRDEAGKPRVLTGKLLVDALGAGSPHAAFDLCCPTVGGVITNLAEGDAIDEVDYKVGEILVSTEGVEDGKQHIWEGFPSTHKRFTTYLFYYDEPQRLVDAPLFSLYERFFDVLPRYKRGDAKLARATYGFIPAYTRLREMPSAKDRVLLVGDAAARQSPLTFCGFGSMVRSFLPVAEGARRAVEDNRLDARTLGKIWFEPPVLKVMGGLTLMMVPSRLKDITRADDINHLLDVAFATLADMGEETYAQFVRDEIGFKQFWTFMRRTSKKRPQIYNEVFAQLSPGEITKWMARLGGLSFKKW